MNEDIQQLVQSFFGKNSIDECGVQELQNAAREYPYSAPLQLILSEKMRSQHPSLYQKQLQKTSLYFHNILWFDFLVNKEEYNQEDFIISLSPQKLAETEMDTDDNLLNGDPWSQYREQVNSEEIKTEVNRNEKSEPEQIRNDQSEPIAPDIVHEPVEDETVPAFEPFHTVDYFASQGIKLTQDEKPTDRLGQQLKSFTEWLKTMKRLPQAEIGRNIEPGSEQKVHTLAEHSLQEPEVVTEAMAEVWEKQGNHQKAIELYTKLSLLNPSKSVYFAAKIEQLKKEMP